jgi:hypothetical protein
MFCRVINERMKTFIKLSECQNGFRKGRSPSGNLFIVNEIMRVCNAQGSRAKAYLGFIDFRKAFDSLHVSTLMIKLGKQGIGMNVIESMYSRSQAADKHNGKVGEFFPVGRGVAQRKAESGKEIGSRSRKNANERENW